MPNHLYIAKQAIYNSQEHIIGYELYYRNEMQDMSMPDRRYATASVLVNTLNQIGLHSLVGDSLAFINIDSKILLTDILYTIPKDSFILEINEDMIINTKEFECIKALHKNGYTFALDNVNFKKEFLTKIRRIIPYVQYVKFDTTITDYEMIEDKLDIFENKKLIAQKVESNFIYETYKKLGFEYFQGINLNKPQLIRKDRIDPHHLGVIKLYNLLQDTQSLDIICDEFQQHNEISVQLLQFVNSGGFDLKEPVKNIKNVLEAIGKKPLMQWLMLIVYSKSGRKGTDDINPSSVLAQNRIDLMLGILSKLGKTDEDLLNKARFIALLSLLESICGMSLPVILKELDVEDVIKDALLNNTGELGKLYALTVSLEKSDKQMSHKLLLAFGLDIDDIWNILEDHLGHPAELMI